MMARCLSAGAVHHRVPCQRIHAIVSELTALPMNSTALLVSHRRMPQECIREGISSLHIRRLLVQPASG